MVDWQSLHWCASYYGAFFPFTHGVEDITLLVCTEEIAMEVTLFLVNRPYSPPPPPLTGSRRLFFLYIYFDLTIHDLPNCYGSDFFFS